jgi:hypothetical protein
MDIYTQILTDKSSIIIIAMFVNVLTSILKSFVPASIEKKFSSYIKGAYRLAVLALAMIVTVILNRMYGLQFSPFDGLAVAITSYGIYEIGYKQIIDKIRDIVFKPKK